MVKEFEANKRYVFDINSYLEDSEQYGLQSTSWAYECDKKEVNVIGKEVGYIQIDESVYTILSAWCIERISHATKINLKDGDEF